MRSTNINEDAYQCDEQDQVKTYKITMPRGDLRPVCFYITSKRTNNAVQLDEIYFTVKKNCNKTDYIFQKRLSTGDIEDIGNGGYQFVIEPEDTDGLYFGHYDFDIELVSTDIKQTFVGELILTKEVTYAANEGTDG